MSETFFECPECGGTLSSELLEDGEQKISLHFFCESDGEDMFSFLIFRYWFNLTTIYCD